MRVVLMTSGSRGDTQPFVAMAVGLQAAGYDVVLGAPPNFADFAAEYDLTFKPLGVDSQALLEDDLMQDVIDAGKLTAVLRGDAFRMARKMYDDMCRDAWEVAQGADVILYKSPIWNGSSIGEALGVPAAEVNLFPWTPTREFPPAYTGSLFSMGGAYNLLSAKLIRWFFWMVARGAVNRFRRETLGEPPFPVSGPPPHHKPPHVPFLYAFSPSVMPKPDDWADNIEAIGYWYLDAAQDWQPPQELVDFLESGPPPIYIGFGSMTSHDPQARAEAILKALETTGQRAILLGGWAKMGAGMTLPDTVLRIDGAPHSWLFPRCAAVVHHGGAGTTAAGLRAGVPSIIVPHNFDQPFWGDRVAQLGVGTQPIPVQKLTAESLAAAIQTVTGDQAMQRRATELGEKIRAEDGIERTIQWIERTTGQPRPISTGLETERVLA